MLKYRLHENQISETWFEINEWWNLSKKRNLWLSKLKSNGKQLSISDFFFPNPILYIIELLGRLIYTMLIKVNLKQNFCSIFSFTELLYWIVYLFYPCNLIRIHYLLLYRFTILRYNFKFFVWIIVIINQSMPIRYHCT